MTVQSINDIREVRDQIKAKLTEIRRDILDDATFGQENEYTHKRMIILIKELLTDLSVLTGAPNEFVKQSTYAERTGILVDLNGIFQTLEIPLQLFGHLETLKLKLRPYMVRHQPDRFIEFVEETDQVLRLKAEMEEALREQAEILDNSESMLEEIKEKHTTSSAPLESFQETYSQLESQYENTKNAYETLDSEVTDAEGHLEQIREIKEKVSEFLSETKSHEEVVQSFSKQVETKNDRLDKVERETDTFLITLEEYEKEREQILKRAQKMIANAKDALSYSTAHGLSVSFDTYKYYITTALNEIHNDPLRTRDTAKEKNVNARVNFDTLLGQFKKAQDIFSISKKTS